MESTTGRRPKLLVAVVVLAAVYWLAMFVGTHVPLKPKPAEIANSLDKLQHAAAFAVLAILLCIVGAMRGLRPWQLALGVLVVIAVYGVLDETTQLLVRSRQADLFDWLADVLGAAIGIAAFMLGWRVVPACRQKRSS